jgi:hypothetical protein
MYTATIPEVYGNPMIMDARFKLESEFARGGDYAFLVGIASWNGYTHPYTCDAFSGACWQEGNTPGTIAFDLRGTKVIDNLDVGNVTDMHRYTVMYTPGLLELYVDEIFRASTSTPILEASTRLRLALFSKYTGTNSLAIAGLHVDYVSLTNLSLV